MRGFVQLWALTGAAVSPYYRITPDSAATRVSLKGGGGVIGAAQATARPDWSIELPVVHRLANRRPTEGACCR